MNLDSPEVNQFVNSPQSQPQVDNQVENQTSPVENNPLDSPEVENYLAPELKAEKYGSYGQQAKAGLEGIGQGLIGPAAPALEQALGVKAEDIRNRAEVNPGEHFAGEVAGLVGPTLLTGGASALESLTQAGALKAAGKLAEKLGGDTLASKIGASAAKSAIEGMMITGSDEASKMILQDPNQSATTALTSIGLSGLLGGAGGAFLGAISPAFEAANGSMLGQTVADFKASINDRLADQNPVQSVTNELQGHYDSITSAADEVYGPKVLKTQEIAKLVPELNPNMMEQAQTISDSVGAEVKKMVNNQSAFPSRLTQKLQTDLDTYQAAVSSPEATSGSMFNAAQDLKQQLQSYAKFDKFVKPVDEAYDFVNSSKRLAREVRQHLEDPTVWGEAAERQQAINSAFMKYLPALQDFEKKFTSKIADPENGGFIQKVDPGKVNTYINQLGKPNAEIKQSMLVNFLKQSDEYKQVIGETHANLGIENPIPASPLNATMNTLKQKTLGSRIGDAFIDKCLASVGGKTVGASVGAAAGRLLGHPGLGAIVGGHTLGPFFSSVLPAIAKAVVGGKVSVPGFKVAADYAAQVYKGNELLTNAAKSIFRRGIQTIPLSQEPSDQDISKLDDKLKTLQVNAEPMLENNSPLQHYLPDHDMAITASAANAASYLNSIRASTDKQSPLDSQPVLSNQQKADYKNALIIAQQPLTIFQKIKDGTITHNDITHLQNMYPTLYSTMNQKIMNQMIDKVHDQEQIPYKTRIGLSMFMAQPLDSTMVPSSIVSAQPMQAMGQNKQPMPQQKSKGSPSSPALQKLPTSYQTPSQSRISRQQKD